MNIILSAFGDKLRSKMMAVPKDFGNRYVLVIPSETKAILPPINWCIGKVVSIVELTFVFRGRVEYPADYPWTHSGEIKIYELEVPK